MRVLYVSKASCVSSHRDKLSALARRVELTLLAPARWGSAPFETATNGSEPYPTVLLPTVFPGHNHFHFYRGLERVLAPGRFDVVHVDEEPYSLVTFQALTLARRLGVPALFFAWQNLDKRLPPPFGALRSAVFRMSEGGIAGNQEAADVLRRNGYRGPLSVIPQMGVDPSRFHPDGVASAAVRNRLSIPDGAFLVGFVGRLVPEKGVDDLIAACSQVPAAHLILIGDGPSRGDLEKRARAARLEGRVHFVGAIPSREVASWIPGLDCLVLPSRTTTRWKEQFGRVLIEAMACEVPVIGSDSGEIPRVIGDAGVVFPEGDRAALARELERLARVPELRERLGHQGRARVLAHYTQDKVAADTRSLYEDLVSRPAKTPAPAKLAKLAKQGAGR